MSRRKHQFGRFRIPKGHRVIGFHKDTIFDDIYAPRGDSETAASLRPRNGKAKANNHKARPGK